MNPYSVEAKKEGCKECGCGGIWVVRQPGGTCISKAFECREYADELCEWMNRAWSIGFKKGRRVESLNDV